MTKIKDMFLTLDEAADILRTNRRHIKRMVEAGILRAKNIGIGEERSF
ncbi:MAG: helix-turn-helix domain-containing protein [Saprospiraceae bacterium]|nr:helix-turn-helix domain-containing protein [Saprospiraceae bacterium]